MSLAWRWLALLAPLALVAAGCSRTASASRTGEPATPAASNPLEITASDSMFERLKLGEPEWAVVVNTLTVAGRVELDETRVASVGSPVMGRITELDAREGQEVTRGQLLAVLNSTGLSDAQLAFLKAVSQAQLAQRAVERAMQLLDAGVIGAAELKRREAELSQAAAEVVAARDELRVLGMPDDAIARLESSRSVNSRSRVVATMDGTIVARKVTVGQVIQPADTLAEIADLTHLWLVADVPEPDSGGLAPGQGVEAEISALAGRRIYGKLAFVSATVNPETRTVRVRMDLPNPQRIYKPAMLATMAVHSPGQRRQVIPVGAVVRDGDREHVFVETSPRHYVLRAVTLGEENGGRRVLIDGLRPGERIVVDGAFHLNNERIRLSVQGV